MKWNAVRTKCGFHNSTPNGILIPRIRGHDVKYNTLYGIRVLSIRGVEKRPKFYKFSNKREIKPIHRIKLQ